MSDSENDPFARIRSAAGSSAAQGKPQRSLGDHVPQAPADAPSPTFSHYRLGPASGQWAYRDAQGAVLMYAVRCPVPKSGEEAKPRADWTGKDVVPLTLWRRDGRLRWEWKAYPDPRPLYGLQQLAMRPAAPVLLVEGEKTADAAQERFPGFVALTWSGGSKAAAKADWSPLLGRDVIIWPDADAPGRKAAHDAARLATAAGALAVAVVDLPSFLPEG